MRPNRPKLESSLSSSNLDFTAAIRFIEDSIQMELTSKQANNLLNNEINYLTNDYHISNAKILLSLLRMHDPFGR